MRSIFFFTMIAWSVLSFSGCGSGGSSEPGEPLPTSPPPPAPRQISQGQVTKGPVENARIRVLAVSPLGTRRLLATTTTNAQGQFAVSYPTTTAVLELEAIGGSYTDESTNRSLALSETLKAALSKPLKHVQINPMTSLAWSASLGKGEVSSTSVDLAEKSIAALFHLTGLHSSTPSNPITTYDGQDSTYGLALAGVSELSRSLGVDPSEGVRLLMEDAVDGQLDGLSQSRVLTAAGRQLEPQWSTQGLADSIEAFAKSTRNLGGLSLPEPMTTSLRDHNGNLDAQNLLSLNPLPPRTQTQRLQVSGETAPGSQRISIFSGDSLLKTLITSSNGQFQTEVELQKEGHNSLRMELDGGQIQRRFSTILDTTPPVIQVSPPLPDITSDSSLSFSILVTDSLGIARITTISASSLQCDTNSVCTFNLSTPGSYSLKVEASDSLNRSVQTTSLQYDPIQPVLSYTSSQRTSANLDIPLVFSEGVRNLKYRFYPVGQPVLESLPIPAGTAELNLDFQGIESPWYFDLRGEDDAGNQLRCPGFVQLASNTTDLCETNFTLDSTPPYLLNTPPAFRVGSRLLWPANLQFSETVNAQIEVSGPGLNISTAAESQSCQITFSPSQACSLKVPLDQNLSDGVYEIQLQARDAAMNSLQRSFSRQLDTQPPDPPQSRRNQYRTSASSLTLRLQGENDSLLYINNQSAGSLKSSEIVTRLSLAANQTETFSMILRDAAGNFSLPNPIEVTQDTQGPQVQASFSHPASSWLTSSHNLDIQVFANEPLTGLHWRLGDLEQSADASGRTTQFSVSLQNLKLQTLSPRLTLIAQDELGNSSSSQFILSSPIDTLPPSTPHLSLNPQTELLGIQDTVQINLALTNPDFGLQGEFWQKSKSGAYTTSPQSLQTLSPTSLTSSCTLEEMSPFHDALLGGLFNLQDAAGNQSQFELVSSLQLDAIRPQIVLLQNNRSTPGVMGLSDVLQFQFSLASADPSLQVSATWNKRPIHFAPQENGAFYKGQTHLKPSDPQGTAPPLVLSVADSASNTALPPVSSAVLPITQTLDPHPPVIAQASVTPSTNATILTLGHALHLRAAPDLNRETATASSLSARASFLSSVYSLHPLPGQTGFEILLPIPEGSSVYDGHQPVEFILEDAGGNLSVPVIKTLTQALNPVRPVPESLTVTASATPAGIGALLHFELPGKALSALDTATASLQLGTFSTSIQFIADGSNLSSTVSLQEWGTETSSLGVLDLRIQQFNGNSSLPQDFYRSLPIDTRRPSIQSLDLSLPSTLSGIGDSLISSLTLDLAQPGSTAILEFLGTTSSLQSSDHLHFGTSTRLTAATTPWPPPEVAATASVIDSAGNTSIPFTRTLTGFAVDPVAPTLDSLNVTPVLSAPWLGLDSSLQWSLAPTPMSTDVTSASALFLGQTLSFGPSLNLTLPLSSLPDIVISSPKLNQLSLVDAAGNQSIPATFVLTNIHIDTLAPQINGISATPSAYPTMGIGDSVAIHVSLSESRFETAVLAYNGVTFPATMSDGLLSAQYSLQDTHPSTSSPWLSLIISDQAQNTTTLQTQIPDIVFDADVPVLQNLAYTAASASEIATHLIIGDLLQFSAVAAPASTAGGTNPLQSVKVRCLGREITLSPEATGTTYTGNMAIRAQDGLSEPPTDCVAQGSDSASNLSSSVSTSIPYQIDAQPPEVQRVEHSAADTKIASGMQVFFQLHPSSASLSDTSEVIGFFNSQSLNFTRQVSDDSFTATYTMAPGKPEHTQTPPQLEARLLDTSGNQGPLYQTTDLPYLFKATPPNISLSHNQTTSGRLGVFNAQNTTNSSVQFELGVEPPDDGLSVAATLLSTIPLSFNRNSDGSLYSALYLVNAVHPYSQISAPLSLTATDSFGNTTSLLDTSLGKAIDPIAPILVGASATHVPAETTPDGWIKIGDSIQFELQSTAACIQTTCGLDPIASIEATFASQELQWTSTDSIHFHSTFVLDEDRQTAAPAPNQLQNIQGRDAALNTTSLASLSVLTEALDSRRPVIQSLSVRSTSAVSVLTVGDYIEFLLVPGPIGPSGAENSGWATASYNAADLLFTEDAGTGTYISTYTVATTHADQNLPLQLDSVYFFDQAGNSSTLAASTVAGLSGVSLPIDIHAPEIVSLQASSSSSATTLKQGDSVTFSLGLSQPEFGLNFHTARYNTVPLSFNSTDGFSYIATYTLDAGHPNQLSTPAQLALTVSDAASHQATTATTSISFLLDPNPPQIQTFDFLDTRSESVGLGQNVTFVLVSAASEAQATVMQVSSATTQILTFAGRELHFTSEDGVTFTTHYTVQPGDQQSGFFSLNQASLIDAADNRSILHSTQNVFKALDGTLPATPSLDPLIQVTQASQIQVKISGQAQADVYLNADPIGALNSQGMMTYTTSLPLSNLVSLPIVLQEESGNQSPVSTGYYLRSTRALLMTHKARMQNPQADLQHLYPDPYSESSVYICGRFGFGKLTLNADFTQNVESYKSLGAGLPLSCPSVLAVADSGNTLLALHNSRIYRRIHESDAFELLPQSAHAHREVEDLIVLKNSSSRAYAATTQTLRGSSSSGLSFPDNLNANGPFPANANRLNHRALTYTQNGDRVYTATHDGLFFTDSVGSFGSWNLAGAGSATPTTDTTDFISIQAMRNTSGLLGITSSEKLLVTSELNFETDSGKPDFFEPLAAPVTSAWLLESGLLLAAKSSQILSLADFATKASETLHTATTKIISLAPSAAQTRLFAASKQKLLLSSDLSQASVTFSTISSLLPPNISATVSHTTSAYFLSERELYGILHGEPLSTASLIQSTQTTYRALTLRPSDQRLFFADAVRLYSTDPQGTATFIPTLPAGPYTFQSLHADAALTDVILAAHSNGLLVSQNAGLTFFEGNLQTTAVADVFSYGSTAYAATPTAVFQSTDSGSSFSVLTQVTAVQDMAWSQDLLLLRQDSLLRYSGGSTTTLLTATSPAFQSLAAYQNVILLGSEAGLWLSTNAGGDFQAVPGNIATGVEGLAIQPDPFPRLRIYSGGAAGFQQIDLIHP